MESQEPAAGCRSCWPAEAGAAWSARRGLGLIRELVDESHFTVKLLQCAACGQCFVSVFCETVDWADGEDPQYWVTVPVSAAEAAKLPPDAPEIEDALAVLAPERRSLCHDYPKGGAPTSYWSRGVALRSHD